MKQGKTFQQKKNGRVNVNVIKLWKTRTHTNTHNASKGGVTDNIQLMLRSSPKVEKSIHLAVKSFLVLLKTSIPHAVASTLSEINIDFSPS